MRERERPGLPGVSDGTVAGRRADAANAYRNASGRGRWPGPFAVQARRGSGWLGVMRLLLGLLLCCGPALAAGPAPENAGLSASAGPAVAARHATAAVKVDGVTLFEVRGVTGYPARERVATVAANIVMVARDRGLSAAAITVVEAENSANIVAGRILVARVFDADAEQAGLQRGLLAQVWASRISAAVQRYRHDRRPGVLLLHGVYVLAATLALIGMLWVGARALAQLQRDVERRYMNRMQGLKIKSVPIIQAGQLRAAWLRILHAVRWGLVLAAFYVYLNFCLSLFPWTRSLAARLFAAVMQPLARMALAVLDAIPDLLFIVLLVWLTRYLLKLLAMFFAALERGAVRLPDFEAEWAWPTYRIVRLLVVAFAVVVAYPYIPGSDSDAFKGVSIFAGVLLSLGSSSLIANVIAGYTMTYRRAFRVGDRIRIDDIVGEVVDTRLLVTRVRSPKNEEVVVPNSMILNGSVVNYSVLARERGLILHTSVGIGYEVAWRQVEAMLIMAATRTPGLRREPAPFVLQTALGDFAVQYEINVYCDQPREMARLYSALHRNILDVFNEYGVAIMTPAYEQDTPAPKTVPKDQWFVAPATRPPDDPTD